MMKVKAEFERQSMIVEDADIAAEAAMSHNICMTYGGYSPCTAVFGVLPRSLYEFEAPTLTAVSGATDSSLTVFESAMRLRQISMVAIQQSIAEDRISRATRSRPHKVDTSELTPGVSEVEIHRENAWRGPAVLLEINEDDGACIVRYQGKPYLLPIRCVRSFRGTYFNLDEQAGSSMYKMMHMVEASQQYKQFLLGHRLINTPSGTSWKQVPQELNEEQSHLTSNFSKWSSWTNHPIHAVLYGQAVHTAKPPGGTRGTFVAWLKGTSDYIKMYKQDDEPFKLKRSYRDHWESVCFMYLFYYPQVLGEPVDPPRSNTPMRTEPPPMAPSRPTTSQAPPPEHMDVDPIVPVPSKRLEPESGWEPLPTPEKKQRQEHLSQITSTQQILQTLRWMIDRSRQVRLHQPEIWADTLTLPRWLSKMTMEAVNAKVKSEIDHLQDKRCKPLVQLAGSVARAFFVELYGGHSFMSLAEENA